jgi:hypothetical protein
MNRAEDLGIEFSFPKPKVQPVFLKNDMPQSIRVEPKFSDEGVEITVVGRHEKDRGVLVGPGQRIKVEEE